MSSSIQRAIRFNVYRRSLGYFEDFRSPGDFPKNIILNGNFEKGRMGNLIILDDAGDVTSFMLDAITGFNNKNEHGDIKGDKYSFYWRNDYPWRISFSETAICYKNDKHVAEYVIDDENRGKWREYDIPEHIHADISIDTVKSELQAIATILNDNKEPEYDRETYRNKKYKDKTDSDYFADFSSNIYRNHNFSYYEEEIFDAYQYLEDKYSNIKQNPDDSESIWDKIVSRNFETVTAYMNFKKVYDENTVDDSLSDQFEKRLSEKLGVPAIPTVHRYSYNGNYRKDLFGKYSLNREEIKNLKTGDSPKLKFWRAFFNSVENFSIDRIIAAYEQADAIMGTLINGRRYLPVLESTETKIIFKEIQKELQPRLDELKDIYNSYFADTGYEIYALKMDFDLTGMGFGGIPEMQLDFLFNFIADNSLKPGDIVIMDDSAIHILDMNPKEQAKYRKFIKDFAVKNDILVIITTRSPSLIDPDNYEEVIGYNQRRFDYFWDMQGILKATLREDLTNLDELEDLDDLEKPKTALVWVGNMTKYIYLTMFKNIFGIENMVFIPCYLDSYIYHYLRDIIESHKNIMLNDSEVFIHKNSESKCFDEGIMKYYNEYDKLCDIYAQYLSKYTAIHSLSNIGAEGNIVDLFSSEDQEKFGNYINTNCHDFNKPKNKDDSHMSELDRFKADLDILKASELKIHAKEEDFSEETIRNFKKLFKLLHRELLGDVAERNKEKILDMIFTKQNKS